MFVKTSKNLLNISYLKNAVITFKMTGKLNIDFVLPRPFVWQKVVARVLKN